MSDGNDDRFDVEQLFEFPRDRSLSRLPSLLRQALLIVWRAAPRDLLTAAGLQFAGGLAVAAQVLVGRELFVRVLALSEQKSVVSLLPWLGAFSVLGGVAGFAAAVRIERQRVLSELVARYAMGQVVDVASAVDLAAFDDPRFHNRLQRAYVNARSRPGQMVAGAIGMLSALVAIAGVSVSLAFIDWRILAAASVGYLPLWLATARASRAEYRFAAGQTERDRRRQHLEDVLTRRSEAAEIRAFDLSGFLRSRYDELYDDRISQLRSLSRRRLRLGLAGTLGTSALNAGAIALLLYFVQTERISLAEAGAAAGALIVLAQRLGVFTGSTGSLYESSLFLEDFTSFVNVLPAIHERDGTTEAPAEFEVLRVDGVHFDYPRKSSVLTDISMEIRRGEVVALVGENGSGKTTLAKLLAGLYQPTSGTITWDGVGIEQFSGRSLRRRTGVIFQDFVRYMLSARDNVAAGDIDRRDDEAGIHEALRLASADDVVAQLRDGLETQLGPEFLGGGDLSGGQWQRVALARGFFRNAPFLILDEPSSALDPRAESKLFASIRQLYAGRTVLLISHRFSTVRDADRIYVLRDGSVIEHGDHDQLMTLGGVYAELFELQRSGFDDPPLVTE